MQRVHERICDGIYRQCSRGSMHQARHSRLTLLECRILRCGSSHEAKED